MYSRYQNRPEKPVRPPENYSGWAFAERRGDGKASATHRIDVAKPSPPPESALPPRTLLPPPAEDTMPQRQTSTPGEIAEVTAAPTKECDPPPKSSTHDGWLSGLGKSFPFSHGIGSEELILLGLILLLSQNEQDPDLPLWLVLLLFSG